MAGAQDLLHLVELGALPADLVAEDPVQLLDLLLRALQVLLAAEVLLEEARVLERDGGLRGEGLEEPHVHGLEDPLLEAVVEVEQAHALPPGRHGDAEDRAELHVGDRIGAGEARVHGGVGREDGAPRLLRLDEDGAGDLGPGLLDPLAVEGPGGAHLELPLLVAQDEERPLGAGQLHYVVEDEVEEVAEVGL